jgi:hypothetical protein
VTHGPLGVFIAVADPAQVSPFAFLAQLARELLAEVMLQRSGVMPVICQLEPAGVPKHVRMGGEGQGCSLASPGHQLADVARGHWAAALAGE